MTGLEPIQILVDPFMDMSSPHLCDCLKMTRQPRNPVTLRGIESVRKFTPTLTQGTEGSFPIHSIGVTVPREIELNPCVWGINRLICVKILNC